MSALNRESGPPPLAGGAEADLDGRPLPSGLAGPFGYAELDPARLSPAPIPAEWILDGAPAARAVSLFTASAGNATTDHWSCTAGTFRWHYGWDETVLFLEGEVAITDGNGRVYHGRPGVSLFLPAGTSAVWHVPVYIRKLAFNHKPMPTPLRIADRVFDKVRRVMGRGQSPSVRS